MQLRQLIATEDGSLSLRDEETGELYHNRAGAYSEAWFNYVKPGGALRRLQVHKELHVLDVCFGLGYNSFVLLEEAVKASLTGKIVIYGIEKDSSMLDFLPEVLNSGRFPFICAVAESIADLKLRGHTARSFNELQLELSLNFAPLKEQLPRLKESLDLVFHDPFSPKHAPELWSLDIFQAYFALLSKRNGAALTYSSAGAVRGGLSEAGFTVRKTSAVGGKSGGTIAFIGKGSPEFEYLELSEMEEMRMSGVSGIPFRGGLLLSRQEVLQARQDEQRRRARRD